MIDRAHAYRMLVGIILTLNDTELSDSIRTFVAKDKDPTHLLILVEEEIRLGINIESSIDLFVSLIVIHRYSLDNIDQLLKIAGPAFRNYISRRILKKLVDAKEEDYLVEFIKHFPEYKALLPLL